jgi:hypothetical protein
MESKMTVDNFEKWYGNVISKYADGMEAPDGNSLTEGGKVGLGFMVGCAMIAHAIVSIADADEPEELWGTTKKPIGDELQSKEGLEDDLSDVPDGDNCNLLADPWDKDSDGNDLPPESPTSWPSL